MPVAHRATPVNKKTNMADVSYIVAQLNSAPFNMKLMEHKFSDFRGLDLLQKVRVYVIDSLHCRDIACVCAIAMLVCLAGTKHESPNKDTQNKFIKDKKRTRRGPWTHSSRIRWVNT